MVSVAAGATGARRAGETAGVKLLRAELMPVVVAVLSSRFGDHRSLTYSEFVTQVTEDLDELRDAGFTLPRTAQEYVGDWIRDGYLIRRPTAAREETVELSRSAADALRFVAAVEQPRSAVTSSRLSTVTGLLETLAAESDTDPATRLAALQARRAEIDEEVRRIEAGEVHVLDDSIATERLHEILRLAGEVPGDFAKVADDLEALNTSLREQIINNEGARGGVLDDVFAGVDLIESSEAGRTFGAFHQLLLDPVLADTFHRAVDAVLDRAFTLELPAADAAFLRRFLVVLQRESAQVRQSLTDFSRSLRRFVETQEYREHKRLAEALSRAEQAVLRALERVHPTTEIGRDLDLTSMTISSIGSWALDNPAEMRATMDVARGEVTELDLEQLKALVRLTEIDFAELQHNVADTLTVVPAATVGDVLARHSASQGLATIVGLLLIAEQHATRAPGEEPWSWTSQAGAQRTVSAPRYVFTEVPSEWSAHDAAAGPAARR